MSQPTGGDPLEVATEPALPDEHPMDDHLMDDMVEAMLAVDPGRLVVRSEFGCVSVGIVGPQSRPRLRIEDLRTRQWIELDAIELESLAWARHNDLSPLLDPSATRWTNRPVGSPLPENGTAPAQGGTDRAPDVPGPRG